MTSISPSKPKPSSVYRNNDRRAAIKRRINERLGSRFVEEKSYAGTPPAAPGDHPTVDRRAVVLFDAERIESQERP